MVSFVLLNDMIKLISYIWNYRLILNENQIKESMETFESNLSQYKHTVYKRRLLDVMISKKMEKLLAETQV